MKKTLLFLSAFTCAVSQSNAQDCTKLFISEYVEGTGNDKALELFNPTASPINLSGYSIQRFSNGDATAAAGGITDLTGTIAAYSTFVIANGQLTGSAASPACSPALQALADLLDGAYPAPTYMNGNDAIGLFNGTVESITSFISIFSVRFCCFIESIISLSKFNVLLNPLITS